MVSRTLPCEVCGQTVKRENLASHVRKVHPRDTDAVRRATDAVREMQRSGDVERVRRSGAPPRRTLAIFAALILVVAGGATVYVLLPKQDCPNEINVAYHIHPHLNITARGARQTIPANVGIAPGCIQSLHTHDTTGTIHVESRVVRDFTLGEFFQVWGQPLSRDRVWTFGPEPGFEVRMTVNGVPSSAYGSLVLRDGQWIDLDYGAA